MFLLTFCLPFLKKLAPALSKYLIWVIVALIVLASLWYLDPYRAKAHQYRAQIVQDQVNAAALQKRTAVIIEQLTADAAASQAAALRYANIKRNIHDAPHTQACAASPSIRAALDGLRDPTSAAGAASR